MNKVVITAIRQSTYPDLMEKYEKSTGNHCPIKVGSVYTCYDLTKPDGLCDSAWESIYPFVKDLFEGKNNFYDGWMKDPNSALISCNDGFRPISFLIELKEE